MPDAFEKMDRMYRQQRYFYDLTRKYYLLGRDRLIRRMSVPEGARVLEVGCGTGRNLVLLAKKHPRAEFFGLDASAEMLRTAQRNVAAARLGNVTLEAALADDFSFGRTFRQGEPFDAIFFSYSISMIPTWHAALANALRNLKSGRPLYVVDFYDQKELPRWFQKILRAWLRRFHVQFWDELIPHLENLDEQGLGKLTLSPLYRRYSFIAEFVKAA